NTSGSSSTESFSNCTFTLNESTTSKNHSYDLRSFSSTDTTAWAGSSLPTKKHHEQTVGSDGNKSYSHDDEQTDSAYTEQGDHQVESESHSESGDGASQSESSSFRGGRFNSTDSSHTGNSSASYSQATETSDDS